LVEDAGEFLMKGCFEMGLSSILSFPDRGKWGRSKYRGNCSGHIIKGLLEYYRPKHFVEVFAGGGTGYDVAKELGYENSVHLDLNPQWGGWNALTDEIPCGSDFVFSHPPYDSMVVYSGNMWGEAHKDDLSRCASYEEFIDKLNLVNGKIYSSLLNGGRHAFLVGDIRKNGKYYSVIKDMAWFGELESHIIKAQHNMMSGNVSYRGRFIPIVHEHLLIFRKDQVWMLPVKVTQTIEKDIRETSLPTWRDLVQGALEMLGGEATLDQIYGVIHHTAKARIAKNNHWMEKVRQTLGRNREFKSISRGQWALAA
jgi:hypothetical protein